MIRLELDRAGLERLFPAYLSIGGDGRVRMAGPALRRLAGEGMEGAGLAELVEEALDLPALAATGEPAHLRLREPSLALHGTVHALDEGFFLALGLVPERAWPLAAPVQIADFSPSDPLVAAILQSGIQSALVAESKAMAMELAEERRRMLELVARISRSAAHMAHEFTNAASIIGLNCERLLREHADDEPTLRLAHVIRDTALRGAAMTQSLLALANRHDDSHVTFALDSVLAEHRAYFALLAGTAQVLEWDLGAGAAQVRVSRSALVDWLGSLLERSRDHGEAGPLTLATREIARGGGAYVAITLLGGEGGACASAAPGFEPASGGAPGFVREAGGLIEPAGQDGDVPGLTLLLPAVAELAAAATTVAGGGVPATAPSRARILVVDDEQYALEALDELLRGLGYAVTACDGPISALEALAAGRFELLLTDVIMPGISGIELATAASRMDPALRIVLMSGYMPDGAERPEEWPFLRKPLDLAQLAAVLAQ